GIGRGVAAEQLARLVRDDGEAARHGFAAAGEGFDRRLASGLPFPFGHDPEACDAAGGIVPDPIDHVVDRFEIDAVDLRSGGEFEHGPSPLWLRAQQKAGATSAMRSRAAGDIAARLSTKFGCFMPEPR